MGEVSLEFGWFAKIVFFSEKIRAWCIKINRSDVRSHTFLYAQLQFPCHV